MSAAIIGVAEDVTPHLALLEAAGIKTIFGYLSSIDSSRRHAAVRVGGSPEAVCIEAENISIAQILAALGRDFNVQYTGAADLDRELSGTYQGSLYRVPACADGYNIVGGAVGRFADHAQLVLETGRIKSMMVSAAGSELRDRIPSADIASRSSGG